MTVALIQLIGYGTCWEQGKSDNLNGEADAQQRRETDWKDMTCVNAVLCDVNLGCLHIVRIELHERSDRSDRSAPLLLQPADQN